MSSSGASERSRRGEASAAPWLLRVYIAGLTPSSMAAVRNAKMLQAEYLPEGSQVEIIDLLADPEAGIHDHVLAVPTVVRVRPEPVRRIVGNLNDIDKTLKVLGFAAP
jgi:circadian clock protein KaiB